jgi:hypothetical protein
MGGGWGGVMARVAKKNTAVEEFLPETNGQKRRGMVAVATWGAGGRREVERA